MRRDSPWRTGYEATKTRGNSLGSSSEFSSREMAAIDSALTMTAWAGDKGHGYNRNRIIVAAIHAGQRKRGIEHDAIQSGSSGSKLDQGHCRRRQARHAHALRAPQCEDLPFHPASDQKRVPRRGLGERGIFDRMARCPHFQRQVAGFHLAVGHRPIQSDLGHAAVLRGCCCRRSTRCQNNTNSRWAIDARTVASCGRCRLLDTRSHDDHWTKCRHPETAHNTVSSYDCTVR
jgi:hypothetical protein